MKKQLKQYVQPVEESEESDDDDKSNITYDENEIKEAYDNIMDNEKQNKGTLEIN